MKLMCNNECYVEVNDLMFLETLPKCVELEFIDDNTFFHFVRFKNLECIDFFMKNDSIVNYYDICNMTDSQIDALINDTYKKIDSISNMWFNSTIMDRKRLDRCHSFNYSIRSYSHIIDSLKKYRNNISYYEDVVDRIKNKKVLQIL